jgi:hypothetical protein
MRTPSRPLLALLAVLTASCGGEDEAERATENLTSDELANRLDSISQVPRDPEEKAAPRRLCLLPPAEVPPEYLAGRACRLSEGAGLLLIAAEQGAVAKVDGRALRLTTAGPVGPSGGFWEAPGVSISIGARPGVNSDGTASRAGVTVGGAKDKPIQRQEANWLCA